MRGRVGIIAVMFGIFSTGVSWLTLQPMLAQLMEAALHGNTERSVLIVGQVKVLLPFFLGLDVAVATLACSLLLYFSVVRPLREAEAAIEQISKLNLQVAMSSGGPLVSRLQVSLQRMATALQDEQLLTKKQVRELRDTNDKLAQAHTELLAIDRLATVGKLAAGVAHEVGNPLSGVLGYLSLLKGDTLGPADKEDAVQRIENEVLRIDQIVRSLLDLGRPRKGIVGPVDVKALVDSNVRLMSSGPDFINVKVHVDVADGLCAQAEVGPLSQVLINLLLNAAQAMKGDGHLWIKGRRGENSARIEVHDSGPGIAEDLLPRLGEPFFSTKSERKGTGLGIAVCKSLVGSMGGELLIENHPEGGAVFTVRLPLS